MSDFYYEARDEAGQTISGRIRAMDVKDAIRQLEANHWDVVSVRTVPKSTSDPNTFASYTAETKQPEPATPNPPDIGMPRLTGYQTTELAGHLAEVMQAGLPLTPGLSALAQELPDGPVRRGLLAMAQQLESGRGLEHVLDSPQIPADLRGTLRAGLRGGRTGEVLSQYVRHTQQMYELRRHLALAWGYPLVLMLATGAIFLFFMWFLVPQFKQIFEDFGTDLPGITKLLVSMSDFLRQDWPMLLLIIAVVWGAFWFLWRQVLSPTTRRKILWCLPLFGNMIRSAAMARFARLLGMLIENQVPLPEALRLAGQGSADAELEEAAHDLADTVETGRPLSGRPSACDRFPATFVQLLSQMDGNKPMADAIHALAETCQSSAQMFESQARVAASRIASLCQPLIVIFTAGLTGFLVIALFMPLIKLLNDLS